MLPPLLIVIIRIIIHHIEEPKFIDPLTRAHHPQPIPQLLLLQELLRPIVFPTISPQPLNPKHNGPLSPRTAEANSQVLEIPPREIRMRNNLNLPIPLLADLHRIPQIPDPPVHLDLVVQELFKGRDIEDFVRGGLGGVDDELRMINHPLASPPPSQLL